MEGTAVPTSAAKGQQAAQQQQQRDQVGGEELQPQARTQPQLQPSEKSQPQPPQPLPQLHFSVDWMTPHQPVWLQHVVPRFAGRPGVRVLEIGCWEGRSALWMLQHVADHPSSGVVCVDPFELCHPPFLRNRLVFEANLRAAGEWDRPGRVTHMHMESRIALPRLIVAAEDAAAAAEAAATAAAALAAAPDGAAAAGPADGNAGPSTSPGTAAPGPPVPPLPLPPPPPAVPPSTARAAALAAHQFDLVYVDGSHLRADVLTDIVMAWQLLKPGGVMVLDDYSWDQYLDNLACHPKQAIDAFLTVFGHQLRILSLLYQVMVERTLP
ncbi:hypothetical protein GPECTOR_45g104 [Gonium pectorale]|uniref:Methyltransferase domain-containing protein n=1 Tax=Gonium pectorale TaxID=33097 RepID=A0A150G8S4_GONPE|nr:hypothetical protein GPECTOR_45g104 [Gonium pectorale]|eukprot:KXZ46234.1 hypothetical protein GPECTOR_45g104 [Gonium pectorale]